MVLERIKEYIDKKGITIAAFERSIGMSNASFGKSLKNGKSIGTDKLENILRVYQDINPIWLLTGQGEMLVKEEMAEPISPQQNDFIYKMYQEKEKQVQKLTEELRAMERKVGNLEAELKHAETLGYRTARNASTKKPSSQPKADAHSASVPLNEQ